METSRPDVSSRQERTQSVHLDLLATLESIVDVKAPADCECSPVEERSGPDDVCVWCAARAAIRKAGAA